MTSQSLTISDVQIKQDAQGRYCLNDLHKAAGGEKRHQPSRWLIIQQTIELIEELKSTPRIQGVEQNQPVDVINGGVNRGTYADKELVYAYATWISAKFFLRVIRAYDSLVTQKSTASPYISEKEARLLQKAIISVAAGSQSKSLYTKLYDGYGITTYHHVPAGKLNEALVFLGLNPPEMPNYVLVDAREFEALKLPAPAPKVEKFEPIAAGCVVIPIKEYDKSKQLNDILESLKFQLRVAGFI